MKWNVFRMTSTDDVWALQGVDIEADRADEAVLQVTEKLPGHLLGAYFAVPAEVIYYSFVAESHEPRMRTLVLKEAEPVEISGQRTGSYIPKQGGMTTEKKVPSV